jgi:hypothetical protein
LQEVKNGEAADHKMTSTTLQKGQVIWCGWSCWRAGEVALLCLKFVHMWEGKHS